MLELLQARDPHKRQVGGMTARVSGVETRMSCRMTLIDNVAPFGLFSPAPLGRWRKQTGFPVAGMDTKSTYTLCSAVLESVSGLAYVSPSQSSTSTSKIDYFFHSVNMVLLTSSQVSVALSSLIGMSPSHPNLLFTAWSVDLRLTEQQSSHVPLLSFSAAM